MWSNWNSYASLVGTCIKQPFWKIVRQYLLMLNICIPFDLAILLLVVYSIQMCLFTHQKTLQICSWWLYHNSPKVETTHMPTNSKINIWQIDGETVAEFIFLGSKITSGGDCSHGSKRRLLLGRKPMTNLDSILKSRDIILPAKIHLVKAMVFPVVMYGHES